MAQQRNPRNVEPLPLTPEEMKAIGEIELGPSRHERFLNAHYKKLILVLVLVMVAAVACIVYVTWRARQEADSAAAVISAMKINAVHAAADTADYNAAVLENVPQDYPSTSAAATAELLRGMQLVAGGQEQQGIAVLEGVIAASPEDVLRVRAQAYLAGYYMNGGNSHKATELWQAVSRSGQSPYLALSLLCLGDLAKEAGEEEQARAYYEKLQKECASSPLNVNAQQRLLLLGVDAPEPVAPPAPEPAPAQQEIPTWNSIKTSPASLSVPQ